VDLPSIALSGMNRAQATVEAVATRVARGSVASAPADTVDLSRQAVDLLQARLDFAANAKALKVADQMTRSALDLLG